MDLSFQTSSYLQEIKEFVAAESKGSTQLHEALQKAIQTQAAFHKLEQDLREKLQKETERVSVLQSSNSALNNSLSEACVTIRCAESVDLLKSLIDEFKVRLNVLLILNN
jgi:uncharacterized phage infection (PIP) family protein YhgE